MTVGNLFLIIILILLVWFGLAYTLSMKEINSLNQLGCKNIRKGSIFLYWVFISFFLMFTSTTIIMFLRTLVIEWNTPI